MPAARRAQRSTTSRQRVMRCKFEACCTTGNHQTGGACVLKLVCSAQCAPCLSACCEHVWCLCNVLRTEHGSISIDRHCNLVLVHRDASHVRFLRIPNDAPAGQRTQRASWPIPLAILSPRQTRYMVWRPRRLRVVSGCTSTQRREPDPGDAGIQAGQCLGWLESSA